MGIPPGKEVVGQMMRKSIPVAGEWRFAQPGCPEVTVALPHTWNALDGQDGGNDYKRCACTYATTFDAPDFDPETQCVYLQFEGVNSSARVELNGTEVCRHDGGYSTFRAEITQLLGGRNALTVVVDNSVNDTVYPQKADFTFYGGIYRDVSLLVVSKHHFDLDYFGGTGIKVTPTPKNDRKDADVRVETWHNGPAGAAVRVQLLDAEGKAVAEGDGTDAAIEIRGVHLWDGLESPYLYTAAATLYVDGKAVDEVRARFGVRDFKVDPKTGFWLNGRQYPLHGVSRHQDRKGLGNAITKAMHDEDMALIKEMGANTIRLAHYQHDQYFYDLCDEAGMVVWAEIPYISEHMPNGRDNTVSQMTELITQNYNHMLDNHRELNDLCHRLDPTRVTTLACYAMCGPFNPVAHITDLVSWNLYLGWYVPGLFLNDLWLDFFHLVYPARPLGYSEYGAEGMPNLHSPKPRRGDHTEDYQAEYHEYMLRCFDRRKWMWATHVWNMFDFAADARDQGGEPGMNHKGLVTFDRKTKKDSFFLYKAWWSKEPFVYIAGRRYADRTESTTTVKIYTNQPGVTLYANGQKVGEKSGNDKVFRFELPLSGEVTLRAVAGDCTDETTIRKVDTPNPAYKLQQGKSQSANWV